MRNATTAIKLIAPARDASAHSFERNAPPRMLGRYELLDEIGSGGMASVHVARLIGAAGFQRTVAIKRLHSHFSKDPAFVAMLLDEALLAGRIRHPYVLSPLDTVATDDELFLVMEYVDGETLAELQRKLRESEAPIPAPIAAAIMGNVLLGLHAAHEACDESGRPLGIVHRDVSPHNILVGADGIARVLDFGVAKGERRMQQSQHGLVKGKVGYMPPEQVFSARGVTRSADIYAAAVVLWEALAGRRLFQTQGADRRIGRMIDATIRPPSAYGANVPAAVEAVIMRGLASDADSRYATAQEMADALSAAGPVATPAEVARLLAGASGASLAERSMRVAAGEARDGARVVPRARAFLARVEGAASAASPPDESGMRPLPKARDQVHAEPVYVPAPPPRLLRIDVAALIAAPILILIFALAASHASSSAPGMGEPPTSDAPSAAASKIARTKEAHPAVAPPAIPTTKAATPVKHGRTGE